jgi:hypothetical protein
MGYSRRMPGWLTTTVLLRDLHNSEDAAWEELVAPLITALGLACHRLTEHALIIDAHGRTNTLRPDTIR